MINNKWFANNSIKHVIIAFGTMFSNLELRRYNKENVLIETQKVPIHYSGRDKMLMRTMEVPDLEKDTLIGKKFPQISFEMTGISYDAERKLNTLNKLFNCSTNGQSTMLVPVPYNLDFELNIYTISNQDALQLAEQILPYFTPSFVIQIVSAPGFPITEVPISLNSVNFSDTYGGNYINESREIVYTLRFTAKANIFGAITDNSGKLIKMVTININTIKDSIPPTATLTVTPLAKTDLNQDGVVNQLDHNILTATDDFGFSANWVENL